jgi:hypothetical protein
VSEKLHDDDDDDDDDRDDNDVDDRHHMISHSLIAFTHCQLSSDQLSIESILRNSLNEKTNQAKGKSTRKK